MRHFWLKRNSKVWDLTTQNASNSGGNFFGSPDGLGVKLKVESFEMERAFFVESVKIEDMDITGKLYFNDYDHLSNFINFVGYFETTETMRLYYSTRDNIDYDSDEEWYKQVLIKELSKSEIEVKTGCLVCNVKFAALSRWKKDKVFTLELSTYGEALVYPYIYPYFYGGNNNVAVEIDNTGNLPTSCIVRVEAESDMPIFRILQNNELLEQAKYNVYVRPNSYMLINSAADKQEASMYTLKSDGTTHREDIYYLGERDYSYSNFVTIPEGKSLFLFSASNSEFGKVIVQYSLQREG